VSQDPWAIAPRSTSAPSDRSIDGSSTPSPGSSETPRERRGRRGRGWTVALVLLLVLTTAGAATATSIALDQRDVAAEWQARAVELEDRLDGVDAQRQEVTGRLDETLDALTTSERDVGELEERVRTLAEEKARAEDTATTVQVERDVFIELSELIADATSSLDTCVTQLFELQTASVEAFNRSAADEAVDVEALNARAAEVTRFCNQARTAAANAEAAADRLLRS
jgi:chromosome segregation ATPase